MCPCTLLELHVGSPWQQPTGAISARVMALTHKPSFGRSVSQKGKWKTRAQAGYEVHSFEQNKKRFSITWWTSSKTFIIQGEDKYRDKILRKIQDLLKSKVNEETNESTVKTETPKRKGRK